jgi:hypothetical protein
MLRKLAVLGGIMLLLGAVFAPAVMASVPKVAIIEEFGATW